MGICLEQRDILSGQISVRTYPCLGFFLWDVMIEKALEIITKHRVVLQAVRQGLDFQSAQVVSLTVGNVHQGSGFPPTAISKLMPSSTRNPDTKANFVTAVCFPSFSLSDLLSPSSALQAGKPPQPVCVRFISPISMMKRTYCAH